MKKHKTKGLTGSAEPGEKIDFSSADAATQKAGQPIDAPHLLASDWPARRLRRHTSNAPLHCTKNFASCRQG